MGRNVHPTSTREYIDFKLEIRKGTRRKYRGCVRSPESEAQEEGRFPFDKRELKGKLKDRIHHCRLIRHRGFVIAEGT
jgi:hypothetical protein